MVGAVRHRLIQRKFEFQIFALYCAIFYFVPYLLIMMVGNPLESSFRPRPNYTLGMFYVGICLFIFWACLKAPRLHIPNSRSPIGWSFFGRGPAFVLALIFLAISIWSALTLGANFRHRGAALSELGAIGFALTTMKIYASTAVIVHYRLIIESKDIRWRCTILYIIAAGFLVNNQTSIEFIIAVAALVGASTQLRKKIKLSGKWVRRLSIALLPLLVVTVFYFGKANKVGAEEAQALISNFDLFFYSFLQRYGYHVYSLSTHVSENMFNLSMGIDAVKEVISVMIFRLSRIMGFAVDRPELGSVARMNFFVLSEYYKERIGASPGMLGSVFFFPGASLAIFYYVFLLRFVISQFWRIYNGIKLPWIFTLLNIFILATAVDAALDSFNPLSNGFIRVFFLFFGARYISSLFIPAMPSSCKISSLDT